MENSRRSIVDRPPQVDGQSDGRDAGKEFTQAILFISIFVAGDCFPSKPGRRASQ